MKFTAALLSLVGTASASMMVDMKDVPADSKMGMKILSKARQLDGNQEWMNTWIAGYSLKFEGCHHISQWNDEANGEEDVRIATKRLVRFRLCPTDYCDSNKGCGSGYGDYIVDMNTYLEAYFEAKQTYQEFKCEYLENYVCYCNNNNGNDNYSEKMCLWDCFASHNMEGICMDANENPYNNNNGQQQEEFELDKYMECAQANFGNRRLEGEEDRALANNNYEWDGNYYIGPYCASQGGAIYLGVFTDDTCTTFADNAGGREIYYQFTGTNLPYGQGNIIDMDCMSCKEPKENNNDGNDAEDADEVAEVCEQIYTMAGKCENNLPYGTVYEPNNNACNYMEGIKIVRKDGTVVTAEAKANKTASVFIGIFVVAFVLLSAYVYYLKTKLDRASINLAE
jgi:hypothetical protein